MLRVERKRKIEAYIPTASMADIAFLLITFFMVATTFQVDKTTVTVPASVINYEIPKGSAFVVVKRKDGGSPSDVIFKFSDGKQTSFMVELETLGHHVQSITATNMYMPFVVKADKDVAWKRIDEVLDELRRASARNVYYMTRPAQERGGGAA
jgi:biopolymer transport protein ExbD